MSENKDNKGNKTSTCLFNVTSTPQGKGGSEPPAKGPKRTISEVSESSAEELTIINQQLQHLTSDLKDTKEKVMNLMDKDEVQNLITETVEKTVKKIMKNMTDNLKKLIEEKIKEKLEDLEDRVKSLQFENGNLKDRAIQAEKDLKVQKDRLTAFEKIALTSAQRSNYNEQYSRKNNVKILNIPESAHETEQTLTEQVCSTLLSKGNVDLDIDDITALHRIPGKAGSPQPVLLKVKNNSVKTSIMKQRKPMKDAGFRLVDDVTKLNTGLIGRLMKHAKIESAWYFNGAVYGKTTEGRRHKFDVYCNIDSVIVRKPTEGAEDVRVGEQPIELASLEP